jgi:transposase-like protein
MSNYKKKFEQSIDQRRRRHFSEELKRKLVKEIEEKRTSVTEICKAHEVSDVAVYRWIELYSHKEKPTRTIVESKSETTKILALQKKVAELERMVGQKQVMLDFKDKMIELAEETYQVDIKKKFGTKP